MVGKEYAKFIGPIKNDWYDIKLEGGAEYKKCWYANKLFHTGKYSIRPELVIEIRKNRS